MKFLQHKFQWISLCFCLIFSVSVVADNWVALGAGVSGGAVNAIAVDKNSGVVYAGGTFTSAGSVANTSYIAKWNGNWNALPSGMNSAVVAEAIDPSGNLYAIGGSSHVYKWSSLSPTDLGAPFLADANDSYTLYSLALDNANNLLVGGVRGHWSTSAISEYPAMTKRIGGSWSGVNVNDDYCSQIQTYVSGGDYWVSSGVCNYVSAIAVDSKGTLYHAINYRRIYSGNDTTYITMWNGTAWNVLGASGVSGSVNALAVDQNNNLYVGGNFSQADSITVNNIAMWDGAAWHALGSGVNGVVNAVAVDSQNGIVYAGGSFTSAGGVSVNNIAMWNPATSTWSALDAGVNGQVKSIAVDNAHHVYVGGSFTTVGVGSASNIAMWTLPSLCSAGSYGSSGSNICTTDAAGTYSSTGAISPTQCPPGTYNPNTGSTDASACLQTPAGSYSNAGSASYTTDPAGTYSAAGAASPTTCANGTYQQLAGQASCSNTSTVVQYCAAYSTTADACTSCASGYNLVGNVCLLQQTITVTTPSPITAAINTSFNVAATASSGLPVSITTMDGCTGGGTDSATITMTGTSSDCTITYDQPGDGTNYDAAPELAFLVSLPKTVKNDFDGDGKSDVLFLNTSTGSAKYWQDAAKTQSIYIGTYNLAYSYQGSGDFDGDGKADLLFVNTSSNATLIWSGAVKTAATYPGAGAAGYNVAAICDTDGDGKDDIVWFNPTTGSTRIWPNATKAAVTYPGIQNTAYTVVACADFDGDKHADIFWRNNTTGTNQVWLSGQKSNLMYPGANTDLTVQAVGAGDTDGDGQADLVWYTPSTAAIRVWLGGLKAASTYIGIGASGFTPKAIADYDGDGMADLLWANDTTLATQIWPAFIKANVTYPGAYPTGFVIQK